MSAVVGIDVGMSGAVAVITGLGHVYFSDAPTLERQRNTGTRRDYAPAAMAAILREAGAFEYEGVERTVYEGVALVVIELVGAMPQDRGGARCPTCNGGGNRQGVVSAFAFGRGAGLWEGIVAGLRLPYEHVSPMKWKREFGLVGTPKDQSRLVAQQLFPSTADQLKLVKHHGRADALLIAEWGRRELARRGRAA